MTQDSRSRLETLLPWGASLVGLAALAGLVIVGNASRTVPLALMIGTVSTVASWLAANRSASATNRTIAAGVGVGAYGLTGLIGLVSFGAIMLPAVGLWFATLRMLPRPPEARLMAIAAGVAVGTGIASIATLAAISR